MTQKELISQIKEARKEFYSKNPCYHCHSGNGCDDCRDCPNAGIEHQLSRRVDDLEEKFKKLYNVEYDDFVKLQKLYSEHPLNKEDLLLLYKDLCGRTTYGTKIKWGHDNVFTFDNNHCGIGLIDIESSPKIILSGCYYGDNIRPYLFPLSSMTEEQEKEESQIKQSYDYDEESFMLFDWYNKNHFDYRGLISKGLAIDATGLNIY